MKNMTATEVRERQAAFDESYSERIAADRIKFRTRFDPILLILLNRIDERLKRRKRSD